MKKLITIISFLSVAIISCDGGLSPDLATVDPGFSGTITFEGEWPAGITRTHIVLFKDSLLAASDFSAENLKYVSEEIPYGTDSYEYNSMENSLLENLTSGEYSYLAVVQSQSIFLSLTRAAWNVVGLYSENNGILILPDNQFVENVNIVCDFENPPPQPPGGVLAP